MHVLRSSLRPALWLPLLALALFFLAPAVLAQDDETWSPMAYRCRDAMAEHLQVAPDLLLVGNEMPRSFPLIGRQVLEVKLIELIEATGVDRCYIDEQSGMLLDDIEALEAAEQQAHRKKYGKLDPLLYDRLVQLSDTDTITVAIRLVNPNVRPASNTQVDAIATVGAQYPESATAVADGGKWMEVAAPTLSAEIDRGYNRALDELDQRAAQEMRKA